MKTRILALFVATAGFASAALTTQTVYSGPTAVNLGISNSNVVFTIPQFNPALGTLVSVTVKVVESALVGSFQVTNNGLTNLSVGPNTADFRVTGADGSLGYTATTLEIDPLLTSPSTSPATTLASGASQTFTITPGQGYSVADQSISSGNFGAYTGTGDVSFNVRNRLAVGATGSVYTVDTTAAYTSTRMAITYTYNAIPEPSAALLGGLGFLCLLRRRR